jgi:hypothetical protein
MIRAVGRLARTHRAFAGVLLGAVLLRIAVALAYSPAIFYFDSREYLSLATTDPIGLSAAHPSGYPLLLKLFSFDGHSLASATAVQHVAGLVTGGLVYALLLRLGVRRWLAVAAAGIVLLDGYAIALEQSILAESFFTLALVLSLSLAVVARPGPLMPAASGAVLAGAICIRPAAFFVVPFWLGYLLWTRREWRPLAAAAAGLAVPLLVYSLAFLKVTGEFGITQADGWFLYGRVAQIADCKGLDVDARARPLCERAPGAGGKGVAYYLWDPAAPVRRTVGGMVGPGPRQARTNDLLGHFARQVIAARPGRYAEIVTADFLRYFQPGVPSVGRTADRALRLDAPTGRPPVAGAGRPPRSGTLAYALRRYQDVAHTPRWLLGPLVLATLAVLLLAFARRFRPLLRRRAEAALFTGAGLAMLLGASATSGFILRYLIPAMPLLVCGGVLAVSDLVALRAGARNLLAPASRRHGERVPVGSGGGG